MGVTRRFGLFGLLLCACGDDGGTKDTATSDVSDVADVPPDTTAGGCATGLPASMSGTWAMEETQTALVQVEPFGTMTQVSTSLYLATAADGKLTLSLCAWETEDSAGLFTTRMGDGVLAHLAPFVRDLHVTAGAGGEVDIHVAEGVQLRGVNLTDPAGEALPSDASDTRVIDQDEDGDPGISLVISGALSGKLFVLHRHKAELTGCFEAADRVSGLTDWGTEQVILGSNPSELSANKPVASTHPDASLSHFTMRKVLDGASCSDIIAERATLFPSE